MSAALQRNTVRAVLVFSPESLLDALHRLGVGSDLADSQGDQVEGCERLARVVLNAVQREM